MTMCPRSLASYRRAGGHPRRLLTRTGLPFVRNPFASFLTRVSVATETGSAERRHRPRSGECYCVLDKNDGNPFQVHAWDNSGVPPRLTVRDMLGNAMDGARLRRLGALVATIERPKLLKAPCG